MTRPPRFAYVAAVFLGVVAAAAPANLPLESPSFATAVVVSTAIFGFVGLLLGALWPGGAWRWGLWVVAPGFTLVTIGLITSGQFAQFMNDDLPFLASGLAGACLGGLIASRLRSGTSPLDNDS